MKIIVNDLAVSYQDIGSGPVIVILHGWGTSAANMQVVSEPLSKKFRTIAIDLPGFGASEAPKSAWGVGEYVDFVKACLDKLGVGELYALIGHSFGGRITLKGVGLGVLQPQKVVLLGSAGVKHSNSLRNTLYKIVAKVGKVFLSLPLLNIFANRAKRRLYESAGSVDYTEANEMKAVFTAVINEDLQQFAAKITTPTLLIYGENDQETPVADARILQGHIKGSELIVIPDAGHFVHTDAADRVLEEIGKFL